MKPIAIFEGTLELKQFGHEPHLHVFLGTSFPLCAAVRQALGGHFHLRGQMKVSAEGASPRTAEGPVTVDCQLLSSGAFLPLQVVEKFTVGEKDVLAYLRRAAGRKVRLEVRVLLKAP